MPVNSSREIQYDISPVTWDRIEITVVGWTVPSGGGYVYRGDPAAVDFAVGDLTTDEAWHTLDLSSIVPANAKAVHLAVFHNPSGTNNSYIYFHHGDATNLIGLMGVRAINGVGVEQPVTCPLNSSREIKYKVKNDSPDDIDITVIGWWF